MSDKWVRFIPEQQAASNILKDPGAGAPSAFMGFDGKIRPQPGDETFPFVKDPPQLFGPALYIDEVRLPAASDLDDYLDGPGIDVRGARHLVLYVDLRQLTGSLMLQGSLSILPEAAIQLENGNVEWWPVGVVDATLVEDAIPREGYSERNVFQTELIWNPRAGLSPAPPLNGRYRLVLTFAVEAYFNFRFRFGSLGSAADLTSYVSVGR